MISGILKTFSNIGSAILGNTALTTFILRIGLFLGLVSALWGFDYLISTQLPMLSSSISTFSFLLYRFISVFDFILPIKTFVILFTSALNLLIGWWTLKFYLYLVALFNEA